MTIKLPSSISFISRLHVTWEVLSTPNVWFISRYFILSFKIPLVFLSCNLTCQFMVKKFIHDESFIIDINRAKICTYRHFIQWTSTILLQSNILVKSKTISFSRIELYWQSSAHFQRGGYCLIKIEFFNVRQLKTLPVIRYYWVLL